MVPHPGYDPDLPSYEDDTLASELLGLNYYLPLTTITFVTFFKFVVWTIPSFILLNVCRLVSTPSFNKIKSLARYYHFKDFTEFDKFYLVKN